MKYIKALTYCILTIGIFSFASCKNTAKDKDVEQLRKELPQIDLPIRFNSTIKAKYRTVELEGNSIIQDLTDERLFSLFGKLFETENNITILGWLPTNDGTPAVITIDNRGQVVSLHELYETVKDSTGIRSANFATVFPGRRISFTDSTFLWKSTADNVPQSSMPDSVIVTNRMYTISENGELDFK